MRKRDVLSDSPTWKGKIDENTGRCVPYNKQVDFHFLMNRSGHCRQHCRCLFGQGIERRSLLLFNAASALFRAFSRG